MSTERGAGGTPLRNSFAAPVLPAARRLARHIWAQAQNPENIKQFSLQLMEEPRVIQSRGSEQRLGG